MQRGISISHSCTANESCSLGSDMKQLRKCTDRAKKYCTTVMHYVTPFVTTRGYRYAHRVRYTIRLYRQIILQQFQPDSVTFIYRSSGDNQRFNDLSFHSYNESYRVKSLVFYPIFDCEKSTQPIDVDFPRDRQTRNEQPINNRPIVNQLTDVVSEGAESGCS